MSRKTFQKSDDEMRVPQKNVLEWLIFALSLVLVVGTLGYLTFSAATYKKTSPVLSVKMGEVQPVMSQFKVPVTITNDGDKTAAGVQIEVTLNEGKPDEEKAGYTTPYLPRHSKREGAVLFKSDPRVGKLEARVLGYENP